MRITESQLRMIIRQEAKQLTEAAAGHGPKINYRRKAERVNGAIKTLQDILADEKKHTGEFDTELRDLITDLVKYHEAIETLSDRQK